MRYACRLCTLLVTISAWTSISSSQLSNARFERISYQNGLSQVTVQSIVRDHQGFMWFATLDGLDRYDGYSIKAYRNMPDDTTSLPDNDVIALHVDREGELWIGTNGGGLSSFDREHEAFTTFRHDPSNPASIGENSLRAICEDDEGYLWIATYTNGVDRLDPERKVFTHFRADSLDQNTISDNRAWSLQKDHQNNIWVGSIRGLSLIDKTRTHIERFFFNRNNSGSLNDDFVRSVYVDHDGQLWIGTNNGLSYYDQQRRTFTRYGHRPGTEDNSLDDILSIAEDPAHHLVVGTAGRGLGIFEKTSGTISYITSRSYDNTTISDNHIWCMYNDGQDRLWLGTYQGGVSVFDRHKQRFRLYRNDPVNPSSLSNNSVTAMYQTRLVGSGSLWVGTLGGGVNLYDSSRTEVTHMLIGESVWSLLETRDSILWVGAETGLRRLTSRSQQFEHVNIPELSRNRIFALQEEPNGVLWIGTDLAGVYAYNYNAGTLRRYSHNPQNLRSLSNNRVLCFQRDRTGVLWIGTDIGLNRFDPATDDFQVYLHEPADGTSLSNNTVIAMTEDQHGNLWLATYGGGVNRLDSSRRAFTAFRERNGLASDATLGIEVDHQGSVWVSTTRGISKIDRGSNEITTYDFSDGLQANEFNIFSHYRAHNGELFFGGINGFNSFFPESLKTNASEPPVVLTEFRVFDQLHRLPSSILVTDLIELQHFENSFSFQFASLDYSTPGKIQYKYKLGGINNDWVLCENQRQATYTHLPPGRYTFEVRASNSDGLWSNHFAKVGVVIVPAFWQTWWFLTAIIVLIASLVIGAVRYRIQRLIEMQKVRLRIASDLHDDIGSNLSSIALTTEMIAERLQSGQPEQRRLGEVSRAAREMVEAMREIVWFIRPENDSFAGLIEKMKEMAASMLSRMQYSFEVTGGPLPEKNNAELRRNLFLIYKEALHNIVRHSRATTATIRLDIRGHSVIMTICDNGAGFDQNAMHGAHGLDNLARRAREIDGVLNIASTPGGGTTINLEAKIA